MEEEEDMLPPFWLQNGQANRRLRRSSFVFLSSGALLIFLLGTALVFIFIIVPTLHSFIAHIFKPHSVKKSWDSLNMVFVLFAVVCAFLSRNSYESPRSYEDQSFSNAPQEDAKSNPETPRSWYEYSDRTAYRSFNRLRSFNSYPDLRRESSWVNADERWRFFDDTHVSGYPGLDLDDHRQLRRWQPRPEAGEEELAIKNIAVDTFVVRTKVVPSAPPLPTPQPSPPPSPLSSSPPPAQRSKDSRTNAKRTYPENNGLGAESLHPRPSTTPPPPPPRPPPPPPLPSDRKTGQNKKKRGSATKEFLTSLRGKKKKQRQRSVENFDNILNSEPPLASQPPPPPPPPPPPSVFGNLFYSKKRQPKKRISAPPPPPPQISSMRESKTKPRNGGVATHKTRLSNKRDDFYSSEENVITGNESPLIPIPPPPPPFKMPAWKFQVQGDFVRIDSISSSRSGSPDLDEVVVSPTIQASQCDSPSAPDGAEPAIPLCYPSPDVDTKADTFIQSFRAGLRMEKMNSMKEKQGMGRSSLGPPGLNQTQRPKKETEPKLKLEN